MKIPVVAINGSSIQIAGLGCSDYGYHGMDIQYLLLIAPRPWQVTELFPACYCTEMAHAPSPAMDSSLTEQCTRPADHWFEIRGPFPRKGSENDQDAKAHKSVPHSWGYIARGSLAPIVLAPRPYRRRQLHNAISMATRDQESGNTNTLREKDD